jgi:hypothetical protein
VLQRRKGPCGGNAKLAGVTVASKSAGRLISHGALTRVAKTDLRPSQRAATGFHRADSMHGAIDPDVSGRRFPRPLR